MSLPELEVSIPRRQEVKLPLQMGMSTFPHAVDELKTIEYSSVPAGGQLEQDLKEYYTLMAAVASNSASEQDLYTLKSLMLKVRSYVLTEDDFNLMSDAIRTTQEYLREAMKAADGNFELVSSLTDTFVAQLNMWSVSLQDELQELAIQKHLGAPVVFGENKPGPSALGYLWLNDSFPEDSIAPMLDTEGTLSNFQLGDRGKSISDADLANSNTTDRELERPIVESALYTEDFT